MKSKIILALVLMNLSQGGRQKRSTVLTDESKRILEHFDFSNFDKQEALNYLDRQRFENQIRGKRSHSKLKKHDLEQEPVQLDGRRHEMRMKENLGKIQSHENFFSLDSRYSNFPDEKLTTGNEAISQRRMKNVSNERSPSNNKRKRRRHRRKKARKYNEKISTIDKNYKNDKIMTVEKKTSQRNKKKRKRHYWNNWSQWSPCSVTCGRGRKVRWRKCIVKNCKSGDIEMGEKTCQLPACNLLTKLLGL